MKLQRCKNGPMTSILISAQNDEKQTRNKYKLFRGRVNYSDDSKTLKYDSSLDSVNYGQNDMREDNRLAHNSSKNKERQNNECECKQYAKQRSYSRDEDYMKRDDKEFINQNYRDSISKIDNQYNIGETRISK